MKIERFEDIEAWQLARERTRMVYRLTAKEKFAKDFGLTGQIQDAAGSSMHKIAEGFGSETSTEFVRFLRYAKRSCSEVQSELYVALDAATYRLKNFTSFTSRRDVPAQRFAVSSTTSKMTNHPSLLAAEP